MMLTEPEGVPVAPTDSEESKAMLEDATDET